MGILDVIDPVSKKVIKRAVKVVDAVGNAYDASGNLLGKVAGWAMGWEPPSNQTITSTPGNYGPSPEISGGTENLPGTWAMSGGNISVAPVQSSGSQNTIDLIMAKFGYDRAQAETLLEAANSGNATAIKLLASGGIEPFASYVGASATASGGSGGGGSSVAAWTPADDAQLQRILLGNRQISALFDPNYPDGAWVPLPDGTMRLNGTEITIDTREKGQYKPVAGAPGYLVDPISGNIIDTNGNQIRREELQEAIRHNQVAEGISRYGVDLDAELGRGKLALDTTLGVGGLNLQAATSENEQALRNALETNDLNLRSYLGTGDLNIGATNAETGRLNALTSRSAAGGQLSADLQKLQDARTMAVIDLMANPNDFVEREYASRALNTPDGYTGPAFRDNPQIRQFIDQLATTPNVDALLPTYQAPTFTPVNLPNSSLPRVTAPAPQPQAQYVAPSAPAPASNRPATQQESSAHFRNNTDVPDWALTPLGLAYGTDEKGTTEDEFVVGDPQADGAVNPELVEIHNPGPETTAEVTPLRDMAQQGMSMMDEMPQGNSSGGLSKLLAGILIEISNSWGKEGGPAKYAYGTDYLPQVNRESLNPEGVRSMLSGMNISLPTSTPRTTNPGNSSPTTIGGNTIPVSSQSRAAIEKKISSRATLPAGYPGSGGNTPQTPFNWQTIFDQIRERFPQMGPGINPRLDDGGLSYFAYGTDKKKKSPQNPDPTTRNFVDYIEDIVYRMGIKAKNMPKDMEWEHRDAKMAAKGGVKFNPKAKLDTTQVEDKRKKVSKYAYGTDAVSGNPNINSQGNYTGPRDYAGNPLGSITTYDDSAIRNLPGVQYALGNMRPEQYNTLNTGKISGAFGTKLPDVGGLNYRQLLDLQKDPSSWGMLSSLYNSANRDLVGIFNRVRERAPIGEIVQPSRIRTGG